MSLDTSTRLLRLVTLLHERRFWSGADLAAALEVTPRSVRRDIDRVRALGYPVHATSGVGGGYSLGAGHDLPPLPLDDDEALAVAVGLRAAVSGPVEGLASAAARALTKLEAVLPTRLRRRVTALEAVSHHAPGARRPIDASTLLALAAASRDATLVTLDYQRHDGHRSRRLLEPYRLVHTQTLWYLLAWDRDRAAWRTFRLDRVAPGSLTPGARFTPRPLPDPDPAAYVARSVASAPRRLQARLLVHAPAAQVTARYAAPGFVVDPIDDHRCHVSVGGDDPEHLALSLAFLGLDLEVLDPPELAQAFSRLALRFHRASAAPRPTS